MGLKWQDAVDFTFSTRKSWKGKESKSPGINTRHFAEFMGEDFVCEEITRKVLRSFAEHLEDTERSDGTINRHLSSVRTVLDHCVCEEELDMNLPVIPRRKEYQGRPFFFTKDQVDTIVRNENRIGLGDLVRFASLSGARMGELLKLQVRDIDKDAGLIYIGGRPNFNTKTGDWRTVPIHKNLLPMLEDRTNGIPEDVCIFGDQWIDGRQVLRKFKQVVRDTGYESHFVFHCLRHSFATWAIEDGVPLRVLMDLMGHKKIETTLRYAKVTDTGRRQAIDCLAV